MSQHQSDLSEKAEVYPHSVLDTFFLAADVRSFVEQQQRKGKNSRRRGWTMQTITQAAAEKFGEPAREIARDIILKQCRLS